MPKGNVPRNLFSSSSVEESRKGSKEKGIGFSKGKSGGFYKTAISQREEIGATERIRMFQEDDQAVRKAEKLKKPWPKDTVGPDSMSQKDWIEHEINRIKRKSGR
jgi:hypothetical protein